MPLSNPGKQPVFPSRFETIWYSCGYGACIDGPNNFSDLHSGHLTVNLRKVPVSSLAHLWLQTAIKLMAEPCWKMVNLFGML